VKTLVPLLRDAVTDQSIYNFHLWNRRQIMAISETSPKANIPAVRGENTAGGDGVFGYGQNAGRGVVGVSEAHTGVEGKSTSADAVFGRSATGRGVVGISDSHTGVEGNSTSADAVFGRSATGRGVVGISDSHTGVEGNSTSGVGVFGQSVGGLAGQFQGDVEVTGDIRLTNADCAEDFNIGVDLSVEPGTVMVLGDEGALFPSLHAYDKRVAGVISGAGEYKPGIVLDKQKSDRNRQPVALLGKVFCKVDGQYGAIEVGDLLTTSPTRGHAMKVDEPMKAFGAVIGKALRPLTEGQGLIPILIALQ
jgi:hypothetical protein